MRALTQFELLDQHQGQEGADSSQRDRIELQPILGMSNLTDQVDLLAHM